MKPKVACIYLNRKCPRRCPYCAISRVGKDTSLSVEEWKEVFSLLREQGIQFFLILGNEPLLLGDRLVDLVRWLSDEGIEYGLYSTSPEPWFSEYAKKLVDAGLKNWSAGVDFIPEVYDRMRKEGRLSDRCIYLVESLGGGQLRKKAVESLRGLEWMWQAGVQEIHTLITISRMNLEMLYDMIVWLKENKVRDSRWKVAYNYVEWNHGDKDFMVDKEGASAWWIGEEDRELWTQVVSKVEVFWDTEPFGQVVKGYLGNWDAVFNQNVRYWELFGFHVENVGVDSDGSLRTCGYRKGNIGLSVFDLRSDPEQVWERWREDVRKCKGCYWVFPYLLANVGVDIVLYSSQYWKNKYREAGWEV